MVRVRISQVGLVATAAALAAAVSACGQGTNNSAQPQPTTPSATSSTTETTSPSQTATSAPAEVTPPSASTGAQNAGNNLCKASDLQLSVGNGDAAAGTVYRPLVFTNVSSHSCVIQGFPGVSYVGGSDGHQVGPAAFRTGDKGGPITLAKGETAHATVGFVNVQNYDTVTCQPQPVRGLRVYPPQETASMYVDYPGTGCGSDKIPGNQLTVKTIEKGSSGD
ncbi:DUF4232 domain-containing protein [Amycolatopsis acidicola]|uniref:DUF4232 domain-containing protein n=1 Tax=Amycolatopsis acidicola TaxID=2596893 RepID=A0A5N0VMP1_9PSEU|nr:DUF4232 domain-containing protein [Amycolatopsis acidicola]KAA9166833.1 DUF4232 domain-containing protein [Amycolatopsis acidicola]